MEEAVRHRAGVFEGSSTTRWHDSAPHGPGFRIMADRGHAAWGLRRLVEAAAEQRGGARGRIRGRAGVSRDRLVRFLGGPGGESELSGAVEGQEGATQT